MAESKIGKPLLYKTADELSEAIEEYFATDAFIGIGDKKIYAPTMSGLAYHLGMDRRSLLNYSKREEYFPTVKRARDRVEIAAEQRLFGNNVAGTIFNLKNNFGWRDKEESEDGSSKALADVLAAIAGKLPD